MENQAGVLGLGRVYRQLAVAEVVAEGNTPAHPHTLLLGGGELVPDTLAGHLPLELPPSGEGHCEGETEQSYIVTTGARSGKSLCFFVPIIDAAIRARRAKGDPRTRALIIYPMNALANSELEALEGFVGASDLPPDLAPTFARFTGQEGGADRDRIAKLKPDILLTNFTMLSLLMTRQDERDRTVLENAKG